MCMCEREREPRGLTSQPYLAYDHTDLSLGKTRPKLQVRPFGVVSLRDRNLREGEERRGRRGEEEGGGGGRRQAVCGGGVSE